MPFFPKEHHFPALLDKVSLFFFFMYVFGRVAFFAFQLSQLVAGFIYLQQYCIPIGRILDKPCSVTGVFFSFSRPRCLSSFFVTHKVYSAFPLLLNFRRFFANSLALYYEGP